MNECEPNDSVVRLFFDLLHGMVRKNIQLDVAVEFAILLGFDGQLNKNSVMEKQLFQHTIHQLKNLKMTKVGCDKFHKYSWITFK